MPLLRIPQGDRQRKSNEQEGAVQKSTMWAGTYTALVTPFTRAGAVDWSRLRALTEFQIGEGVDGLVPVGTTGESPTLDYDEHIRVVEEVVEAARGRVPVIAGTGANSTQEAMDLTRRAKEVGAQATLQVTPYYNKPTQSGLLRHFSAIADLGLPVILYNVPGRTSCEIAVETVATLARHPGIVAIKEAGGQVDRVSRILDACAIEVLSGDDSLTLPMMAVGAIGVISVASNVVPRAVGDMVRAAREGRWGEAQTLHRRLHPLFRDLFIETSPQPVKAALAMMGRIEEVYRLPLCEMAPANRERLAATLRTLGLVEGRHA
jgi:4-hydroxy-tetrahydrodipicolinate synthase